MLRKVPLASLYICYCGITLLCIATAAFSQSISQTNSILGIHKRLLDLSSQVLTISKDLAELQKALAKRDPARERLKRGIELTAIIVAVHLVVACSTGSKETRQWQPT